MHYEFFLNLTEVKIQTDNTYEIRVIYSRWIEIYNIKINI